MKDVTLYSGWSYAKKRISLSHHITILPFLTHLHIIFIKAVKSEKHKLALLHLF